MGQSVTNRKGSLRWKEVERRAIDDSSAASLHCYAPSTVSQSVDGMCTTMASVGPPADAEVVVAATCVDAMLSMYGWLYIARVSLS